MTSPGRVYRIDDERCVVKLHPDRTAGLRTAVVVTYTGPGPGDGREAWTAAFGSTIAPRHCQAPTAQGRRHLEDAAGTLLYIGSRNQNTTAAVTTMDTIIWNTNTKVNEAYYPATGHPRAVILRPDQHIADDQSDGVLRDRTWAEQHPRVGFDQQRIGGEAIAERLLGAAFELFWATEGTKLFRDDDDAPLVLNRVKVLQQHLSGLDADDARAQPIVAALTELADALT